MFRVSKGVRDIPGSLQSATSNIPSGKALMYFGLFLATGVFFIFMAFALFLPVIVLVPQKFAICFTLGCSFIIGSFFALRGTKNQFAHMSSKEVWDLACASSKNPTSVAVFSSYFSIFPTFPQRLPFTLGFLGSMIGTLYVSMGLHSYILSVLFSVIQVFKLMFLGFLLGSKAQVDMFSILILKLMIFCLVRLWHCCTMQFHIFLVDLLDLSFYHHLWFLQY